MTSATAGAGRGGRKGSWSGQAGATAKKRAFRFHGRVAAERAPDDADDTLPMAPTFDVDATREPAAPDGIVDDYPRIDGAPREEVDEPDAVGRRR
jgi:hypothetical protein